MTSLRQIKTTACCHNLFKEAKNTKYSDEGNVSVRTHVGSSALANVKVYVYTGLILIYKYDTASHAGHVFTPQNKNLLALSA